MREREIEAHFVERVRQKRKQTRKLKWIGRRGAPDRVAFLGLEKATSRLADAIGYPNHVAQSLLVELLGMVIVWPEFKAPGVLPEPHQLREHERMRRMGQRVVVIDSIEGVDALLA